MAKIIAKKNEIQYLFAKQKNDHLANHKTQSKEKGDQHN